MFEGRPAWATGAFAIAVFGGLLGCIVLLFQRSSAFYLFIASLLGVVIQAIPYLGVTGLSINLNAFEISVMVVLPLVVAAFQVWCSMLAKSKGWAQ